MPLVELTDEELAVQIRKTEIDQAHFRTESSVRFQSFRRGAHTTAVEPRAEQRGQRVTKVVIVLHDQNAGSRCCWRICGHSRSVAA
jgi:hypothetical protein